MRKWNRALFLAVLLAGCGAAPQEAALRDVRPLKLERGDKFLVEANGPFFTPGAPTTVIFDKIAGPDGKPLTIAGRATAPDRVVADADERLEQLVGARHIAATTTVTVEQTVDGKVVRSASDPRDPFDVDLFPHNLLHLANGFVAKVSGGEVLSWLGVTAKPAQGGVAITSVARKFEKDAIVKQYDRVPLDGEITKAEAQEGHMPDAEFARLDSNKNGVIQIQELEALEEKASTDSLAAVAGLADNDLIVKANGKPVATTADLEAAWQTSGDKVTVDVLRAGAPVAVDLPTAGKPAAFPSWIIFALALLLAATLVAIPVPVIGGLVVVWERKVSAYMQSRLGPNRVGPGGWLQWLADGLKLIMKEDIVPTEADPILFKMSPFLAFIGMFLVFIVLPFSHYLIVADLNIGLLFFLSVTSLVVVGIIMGGWSSNSKWALLGGMRSAAQIISYELPASVALLTIATLTGSLSTQKIVEAQGGAPWNWYLFRTPFTFAAFFIWFVSALAEGNRTPFDLPEAESELVSGYNTEYSGFRFALFPLVEWVNLFIIGAVASMLFLGGWNIPGVTPAMIDQHPWLDLIGMAIFLVKDVAIIFVIIWIRWTLPRFRVDQMMNLCWKYFIPISFAGFVGVIAWTWFLHYVPTAIDYVVRFAMFGLFGLAFPFWFGGRVRYNSNRYTDLVINEPLGRSNI